MSTTTLPSPPFSINSTRLRSVMTVLTLDRSGRERLLEALVEQQLREHLSPPGTTGFASGVCSP